jgi:hypothetical protein
MRQTMSWIAVAVAAATVMGCGGGGGGSDGATTTTDTGDVSLAVTDAATDEVDVFEVDIVSFRFEKANGASVEVLPQTTRVDFAQLVSVSELIAGASLPVGVYTQAFITIDFATAQARITGNTSSATLVDGQGQALNGREELELVLPSGGFTVAARRGYFAVIDFDLDQSLAVDAALNRVTVDSVLYAQLDPAQPKDTRVTGLASAYTATGFALDVRVALGLVSRGQLTATMTSATAFDLGGQVLTGSAGIAALTSLGDGTLVACEGRVDPTARTIACARVVVLPQGLDEVGGLVVARTGGPGADATLTLRGVAVRQQSGSVTFNDTVTLVTSFAGTAVNKRGAGAGTLTTDAINVGQRILAYGRMSGSTLDLTQPDAGFVRLVETGIGGALATTPAGGQLTLDVTRIGRRLAGAFDFTVDGVLQADRDALVVDAASLGASLTSGTPVLVRGFFAPVSATATTPDFVADSVIDRSDAGSLVRVLWLPGTTTPIAARAGAEATIDISQAASAVVDWGLVAPTPLTADPTLAGTSGGLYALRAGPRLTYFADFASFLNGVEAELATGRKAFHLRALGRWDDATGRLTAARAVAVLY